MGRLGERETMSEHDEEEDSYDEEIYETRSGRSGAYSGMGGAMGRRSGRSTGRRDRERERSVSRERSLSPRSDRRSHNQPPRPAKVTLVKSRKNEGEAHKPRDKRDHQRVLLFVKPQLIHEIPSDINDPAVIRWVDFLNTIGLLYQPWLTAKTNTICEPQQNPS